jgi:hypothetical protein
MMAACGWDGWECSTKTTRAMEMEDCGEDVEHVRQRHCHHGRHHEGARVAAELGEGSLGDGLGVGREQL